MATAFNRATLAKVLEILDSNHAGEALAAAKLASAMVREAGYGLVNADVTVLAEAPRIAAHRAAMAANLAQDLDVTPELINIKATTTERMGFVGRGEGLAAQAAVLLEGA